MPAFFLNRLIRLNRLNTYLHPMSVKVFGKRPFGERLERIKKSENYRNGSFQNLSVTPVSKEGVSIFRMMYDFINKPSTTVPSKPVPSIKTNLKNLQADVPVFVWFGHSSYLLFINGKTILVDPVMSGNASPVAFFGKAFPGADAYTPEDLPPIDVLILSHDHYDHLDFNTILKLREKTKYFCTSLGVGSHLEKWGVETDKIVELDWWETAVIDGLEIIACPARHFSGRGISRGNTLWSSFVLNSNDTSIYLGGDSGYDTHFKDIGEKYGPFDLAILECGQYNENWPYIHMMPEQTVQAAIDLDARFLVPVHWGKFSLALHPWTEPIERITAEAERKEISMLTPMIGEPVRLGIDFPDKKWWG